MLIGKICVSTIVPWSPVWGSNEEREEGSNEEREEGSNEEREEGSNEER